MGQVNFAIHAVSPYPYINWLYYGFLVIAIARTFRNERQLLILLLSSIAFETAFILDVGFWVRPSYIVGLVFIARAARRGWHFPFWATCAFGLLAVVGMGSILLNADLTLHASGDGGSVRETFLRPLIQSAQYLTLFLIAVSCYSVIFRGALLIPTLRAIHWLGFWIAVYGLYEIAAFYLPIPFVNLDNSLTEYFRADFPIAGMSIPRAHATFLEPINLNNFLFLGAASTLALHALRAMRGWRLWVPFVAQFVLLVGTFSRSTLLTLMVLAPMLFILYPRNAKSIMHFIADRGARAAAIFLAASVLTFVLSVSPEQLRASRSVLAQLLFSRIVAHQDGPEALSVLGRSTALGELEKLMDDGRLAFGVGFGNEVNWFGGVFAAKSLFNQIIIVSGVIGLAIFFWFVMLACMKLLRRSRDKRSPLEVRRVCWIFCVTLVALLTQRLSFSGFFTDTYLWVAFALCVYLGQVNWMTRFHVRPKTIASISVG